MSHFDDELHECRSIDEFDGLIDDLNLIGSELNVEIEDVLKRAERAKAEFEEQQDTYADHMEDEWKERWRDERETERDVAGMFDTLRGDRG